MIKKESLKLLDKASAFMDSMNDEQLFDYMLKKIAAVQEHNQENRLRAGDKKKSVSVLRQKKRIFRRL